MSTVPNPRWILLQYAKDTPVPGQTTTVSSTETIDLDKIPLNGGFLRELVTFGVESHLRAQMSAGYNIPIPIGGSPTVHAVARVVRSEHPKFKVGDHIKALFTDVVKYEVVAPSAADSWEVLQNPHNLPWHRFLGIAGMSGRTAYYGYRLLTGPNSPHPAKKGETIYISTAAGPVGSLLVQHFKQLGLKVIGSTGSQDKVQYLKEELGCDVAFSYKDETVDSVLKREGPIDIYWDNVGGDSLEAAVANMNRFGRVVSCGFTSTYGTGKAAPFLSMLDVMFKSITIQGLYWDNFAYLYEKDFENEIMPRIATGEFKFPEHVIQGFENVEQALVDVLRGSSFGKTVVVV